MVTASRGRPPDSEAKAFFTAAEVTLALNMAIHLKVEMMPGFRARGGEKFNLELPEGATVGEMLAKVGLKGEELDAVRVFVNEQLVELNKVLKDGDDIWVGVVIGGG